MGRGSTVYIIRQGSAPLYDLQKLVEDVRLNAEGFGVAPERLGTFGTGAGGHLTLIRGTTGDGADYDAKEDVMRQTSREAGASPSLCPRTFADT